MLCRLFDDSKYMYIYLIIHEEYCYLGKQKISLYFPHQLLNTCEVHLVKCTICSTSLVKMLLIGQLSPILKVY